MEQDDSEIQGVWTVTIVTWISLVAPVVVVPLSSCCLWVLCAPDEEVSNNFTDEHGMLAAGNDAVLLDTRNLKLHDIFDRFFREFAQISQAQAQESRSVEALTRTASRLVR